MADIGVITGWGAVTGWVGRAWRGRAPGRPAPTPQSTVATLSAWLPAAVLAAIGAAFVLPSEPSYALVFYLAVLPCLMARLWRARRCPFATPAQWLAAGLIAWSGLTLLWGIDDGHRTGRFLGDTLATLGFLTALVLTLRRAEMRRRLRDVLVGLGCVNAAFSIDVNAITHPIFPRLHGWGVTGHVILGALVMAVPALTALARALGGTGTARERVVHLAAFTVMAVFILRTESRGPLLAASVGLLFLCVASRWRVRAVATLAAVVGCWFLLPTAARRHGTQALVERGSSHRFQVWETTLGLIRQRPMFGHGLAANLHLNVGDRITFPHDLYLSLLFYSGVVGFGLFAAMAGLVARGLWRGRKTAEWAWLVALFLAMLAGGLTDLGQITKGPGPLWFIVWLPFALAMTAGAASSGANPISAARDPLPDLPASRTP